ncbi:MAG: hypothetical protein PHI27_07995 [Eubacteriales bacterium]|nr:hypothetical protein [Eubacteriales bacterium]MDD4513777.1 hypothetical protein [Eubacteriales bacterium]
MNNTVSEKLKSISMVVGIIGGISSVIYGCISFTISFFAGIIVIVAGVFGAYVSYLLIYGFGELLEETVKTRMSIDAIRVNAESQYSDAAKRRSLKPKCRFMYSALQSRATTHGDARNAARIM